MPTLTKKNIRELLEHFERADRRQEELRKQRRIAFEAALEEYHHAFDAGDMSRLAKAQQILDTFSDFKIAPMPVMGELFERHIDLSPRYAGDNSPHVEVRINPNLPANAFILMASNAISLKDIQTTPGDDGLTITATWEIDPKRISIAKIDNDPPEPPG